MDVAAGGSLLARGPEEDLRIIEEMASNSFQWPAAREGVQILMKVASTSSSDALGLLAAQMATLNSKIEAFTNPKAESSHSQFEEVNYVNQGGFSNQQRPFNPGYKPQYGGNQGYQNKVQHPNLSYSNPNNAIQPPPGFSVTNGVIDEEKKPKMDDLLMAFMGKMENYMKESQTRVGNQHQQGKFLSNTTVNPKDQCKTITLRSGSAYDGPEMPDNEKSGGKVDEQPRKEKEEPTNVMPEEYKVPIPYPQRLQKVKSDEQFSRFLDIFRKESYLRKPKFLPLRDEDQTSKEEDELKAKEEMELKPLPTHLRYAYLDEKR
ncbi:hypothetical protein C2S51_006775 [Perilla frutescens var. frutescens]|nr:hypothetical protein C2S51_006775 [Perilla frutescens var. frutescens]